MSIELRSVGYSPGAYSLSCVITKPSGLAVGDFMIALMELSGGSFYEPPNGTIPTGFTRLYELGQSSGTTLLDYKIADADDVAASDFTWSRKSSYGSAYNIGCIAAFTGVNNTTPIDKHNYNKSFDTSSLTTTGITPTNANSMIVLMGGVCSNTAVATFSNYDIATSDPSWSEAADVGYDGGTGFKRVSIGMGYGVRAATSPTGTSTITASNNAYWGTIIISLNEGDSESSSSSSNSSSSSSESSSSSSSSESSSSSSSFIEHINGCYSKNGDYFNSYPVFSNSYHLLFRSDGKWAICDTKTDNTSLWLYYSDTSYEPSNGGNVWNKGIGSTSAGYFNNDCPG